MNIQKNLLTLSERLADGRFEQLAIGSKGKNLTTGLFWHLAVIKMGQD